MGAGLYVGGITANALESAVVDNTATGGTSIWGQGPAEGGGASVVDGTLTLTNTTLSGNAAAQGGGGVHANATSTLALIYATVAENTATAAAGGIAVAGGPATLAGTVIVNNTGGNCAGPITDGGDNLQYPGSTCGAGIPATDPLLGPLEAGARTFYHPLLPGSPARDTADQTACPATDQRGVPRPLDGDGDSLAVCDIGAIEANFPLAPGDLIFRDGFDSGDLSGWSAASTDGGDLSLSAAAALDGTAFGLQALVDDTAGLWVQDGTPEDEDRYRARFYFDPNDFDPGSAAGTFRTRVFVVFEEGPTRRLLAVVLRRLNGEYSLMARTRRDDNSQADTGFVPITPGTHFVEIDWRRSSGPDANDGSLQLWIDGIAVATLAGLDNSASAVDFARLGALSVKPGSAGTLYWDAFESRRESYIGP